MCISQQEQREPLCRDNDGSAGRPILPSPPPTAACTEAVWYGEFHQHQPTGVGSISQSRCPEPSTVSVMEDNELDPRQPDRLTLRDREFESAVDRIIKALETTLVARISE